MSGLYGSIGFARRIALSIEAISGRGVSDMRERGAVGHLRCLGAQAVGAEGVTFRRLCAVVRGGLKTAQDEQRQGLRAAGDIGGVGVVPESGIAALKEVLDSLSQTGQAFGRGLAFPNDQHLPAQAHKRLSVLPISRLVSGELLAPVCHSRHGHGLPFGTRVPVPEASVNHYHLAARTEHEIGTTRQGSHVEAASQSELPDRFAADPFGLRVLGANRAHALTALLLCRTFRPHRGRGV